MPGISHATAAAAADRDGDDELVVAAEAPTAALDDDEAPAWTRSMCQSKHNIKMVNLVQQAISMWYGTNLKVLSAYQRRHAGLRLTDLNLACFQ